MKTGNIKFAIIQKAETPHHWDQVTTIRTISGIENDALVSQGMQEICEICSFSLSSIASARRPTHTPHGRIAPWKPALCLA